MKLDFPTTDGMLRRMLREAARRSVRVSRDMGGRGQCANKYSRFGIVADARDARELRGGAEQLPIPGSHRGRKEGRGRRSLVPQRAALSGGHGAQARGSLAIFANRGHGEKQRTADDLCGAPCAQATAVGQVVSVENVRWEGAAAPPFSFLAHSHDVV